MTGNKDRYHHGDLRRTLLDRAERLVDETPHGSISMRRLAQDAGVSSTAPKAHFDSKLDLLLALATRGFCYLRQRTYQVRVTPSQDPFEHIRQLALAYLRFSQDHPGLYHVMFSSGLDHDSDPELQKASSASYAVLRESLQSIFHSASERESEDRSLTAWALVHGFSTLLNNGPFATAVKTDTSLEALASIAAATVIGQHPTSPQTGDPN